MKYSAIQPSTVIPAKSEFKQMLYMDFLQKKHSPQTQLPTPVTRSPTLKSVTPSPTSTTIPANSCPKVSGALSTALMQGPSLYSFKSVPQIPAKLIFAFICPGPGDGSGTSSYRRSFLPYHLRAFIFHLGTTYWASVESWFYVLLIFRPS